MFRTPDILLTNIDHDSDDSDGMIVMVMYSDGDGMIVMVMIVMMVL